MTLPNWFWYAVAVGLFGAIFIFPTLFPGQRPSIGRCAVSVAVAVPLMVGFWWVILAFAGM